MERTALKKLIINNTHMGDLVHQGRMMGVKDRVLICIRALDKKAYANALPNGNWYRPVLNNSGVVVGYVVGRGLLVASNLSSNMTPRGVKV